MNLMNLMKILISMMHRIKVIRLIVHISMNLILLCRLLLFKNFLLCMSFYIQSLLSKYNWFLQQSHNEPDIAGIFYKKSGNV